VFRGRLAEEDRCDADASTTATGNACLSARADDAHRRGRGREAGSTYPRQHVAGAERLRRFVDGRPEDGHELALQRAVMTGCALLEPLHDVVWSVLDRQIDGHLNLLHSGSILAPGGSRLSRTASVYQWSWFSARLMTTRRPSRYARISMAVTYATWNTVQE
jgi:hypothetical protein